MRRLLSWLNGLVLLTIITGMGCFSEDQAPDVSDINITLESVNYDDAFLALKKDSDLKSAIELLKADYLNMTNIYIDNIMQFRKPRDTSDLYIQDINGFLKSREVEDLKSTVDSVFSNRSLLDIEFEKVFKYLKYYFPNRSTPRLYYLMTEYSYAAFIFPESEEQDALGISLDMFLGTNYPYKKLFPTNPAFSEYLTRTFDPAYLIKKGVDAIVDDIVGLPLGQRMIDKMIQNGKKQYILERLLPSEQDTILWEYSNSQMNWVQENELNLYAHFTSQKMLYSEDEMKFTKFVNPSPNSPGLPEAAPGRTANFIGYKIIEAYMSQTGESLTDLVRNRDTQAILNAARYKPSI